MKKLGLIVALLLATTTLQAETLMGTFEGKLRGSDTRDQHSLDLSKGEYRYDLKLSGDNRARAKLKIKKKRLSGTWQELVVAKKLKSDRTHEGTFNVDVRGVVGQNTRGTRETHFIVSKKVGPRQINYTLKIYKK
ncbi:hypothetical protein KKC13_09250 [bacterium]|nr:hypothetical protein [bacterium]MBU1957974.1 hypothetical protein [bacterium]